MGRRLPLASLHTHTRTLYSVLYGKKEPQKVRTYAPSGWKIPEKFPNFRRIFQEAYSVCEVTYSDTVESDGIHPKENGLSDCRMGPVVVGGGTRIKCASVRYFGETKIRVKI